MRALVVVAALVLVAACGSGGTEPSAGSRTPPRTGSTSDSPSSKTTTTSGSGSGSSSTGVSSSTQSIAPSPAPIGSSNGGSVVLSRRCVHRGDPAEQQTVTVRAGYGETVTYSTYYSDYSTELNRPDYTTGQGYGQAGSDGRFRASWTVPAAATPGRATVRVTASDMTEDSQEASFTVVKQGERCS